MSENPDDIIRQIAEAGKGVRFGRGVVGKTGHAVIAVIALWGLIIWRLGDSMELNAALLAAGVVGTAVFVWWTLATQRFAERNPAQAMLEGAEFLEYQRFEAQTKLDGRVSLVAVEGGMMPEKTLERS